MNRQTRSHLIFIPLTALLLMVSLLVAKTSLPLSTLTIANEGFYQLKQRDNDIELALLRIRNGSVLHYDEPRILNQHINTIYYNLTLILADADRQTHNQLAGLKHQLIDKENLTEQFKSDFAIFKNATTYLPRLFNQLSKTASDTDRQQLMKLQGLFFHQFLTDKEDKDFLAYFNQLHKQQVNNEQWQNLLLHISYATDKQLSINQLLKTIQNHPVQTLINHFHNDYVQRLEQQLESQQQAIYASYAVISLLLLFCLWLLLKYRTVNANMLDLNSHLETRITLATTEIRKEKQKVEAASQAKSQFLTRMSHELRTPLNAIIGFSQLQKMKLGENASDSEKQSSEQILNAGQHLLGMINDILDIVSLGDNSINIKIEKCQLGEAIRQSIQRLEKQAQDRGISIDFEPTNLSAAADTVRLQQVLFHLLSNAVKYNVIGGSILITVSKGENNAEGEGKAESEHIKISIEDTGCGIAQDDLTNIFEPFSRLQYADENEVQGAGIGLTLVKLLMQQMNGTVGVNSKPGAGSTFWLLFPL